MADQRPVELAHDGEPDPVDAQRQAIGEGCAHDGAAGDADAVALARHDMRDGDIGAAFDEHDDDHGAMIAEQPDRRVDREEKRAVRGDIGHGVGA